MEDAGTLATSFYDSLAPTYDRLFTDWDASCARQGVDTRAELRWCVACTHRVCSPLAMQARFWQR